MLLSKIKIFGPRILSSSERNLFYFIFSVTCEIIAQIEIVV